MAWIGIAVAVGVLLWALLAFNGLVRARNQVRAAFSDIDVQLTRRYDLVPQLVAAVRAYAGHERHALEAVTSLRSIAMHASSLGERSRVENALGDQVGRLVALAEAYPELKAGENFMQLSNGLVEVEDHLQYARRFYNGAVRQLNDRIQRFPDLLIARPLGFVDAEFYSDERADYAQAPKLENLS
jgi:LemA protein